MERTIVDGRYDVVRPLGGGGMGEVYLARDQVLDREVALKVLRRQYAGDSEFAERFKREALNAASLSHPNIVQIYDRGQTEHGSAYIAMEYVPGGTLKEKITREGPLETAVAASIGSQVAEALEAAHAKGVVHRDIKPQNVLLTG
ncbi:MAG: protein kinase, partial [Actinomycetota bacterium]|nr:protein kinase [Actinomycetota bacterium]